MHIPVLLALLLAVASADEDRHWIELRSDMSDEDLFVRFADKFSREYLTPDERAHRFAVFQVS